MSFRRNAAHKQIFYYTYNIPQSCYQLAAVYIVRHSPRHATPHIKFMINGTKNFLDSDNHKNV